MSDNNPNNNEGSPVKGLFRSGDQAENTENHQNAMAVPDTGEIHMAEEELPQPRGKLRSFFDKIVEILKQPDDTDLMLDDDDEVFEDIFAAKPEKKSEKPEPLQQSPTAGKTETPPVRKEPEIQPEAKKPVEKSQEQKTSPAAAAAIPEVKQREASESEAVLYRAEKPAKQQPAPKPAPQPKQEENKTEIRLDDILRVSSSVTEHSGFRMTAGEIFGRNTAEPEIVPAAPPPPATEEMTELPPEEIQGENEELLYVRKPPQKSVETVTSAQKMQSVPEEKQNNGLSHDSSAPASAPARNDELSHTEKPPAAPAAVQKNELSHDSSAPPPASARNDELSHTEKPPAAPAAVQKNELSHDSSAPPSAPARNDELSHTEKSPAAPSAVQKNELSHDSPAPPPAPARNDELSYTEKSPAAVKPNGPVSAAKPGQHKPEQPTRMTLPQSLTQESSDQEKQGFSEGRPEPLVYKSGDAAKMVIMAGKFTSTVKTEYLKIRKLRTFAPPPKPKETALERPAAEESRLDTAAPKEKTAAVRKAQKNKKIKQQEKNGFKLSDIFGSHDYEFLAQDYEDDDLTAKPQIDDYSGPEDKESIKTDLGENMRKVFARTVVLCVTCAASVINALLCQLMPELYNYVLRNGWLVFGIISFVLLAVSVFVTRYQIVNGLMPLRHFKGNSDTAVAAASVAGVIQSVTALFMPEIYVNGTYHLYVPLVILALLLHSFGNLLIVKRTADNFAFLSSSDANYAGKIYTDSINAEKFASGLPSRHPLIAYVKESRFMTNFLRLSYEADPVESIARFIAPFTVTISLVLGLGYGLITRDFISGVSSFAIFSVITTPMCSMIAINMPLKDLCASTLADGAMVAGYETVRQFGDTNVLMLDASQLYPKGNIILSGIRSFNESKLKSAIMAGAAVTFAVDGPMAHIFDTIIQSRTTLPEVTTVSYDDGLGLRGWIGGQRVLIGNRKLLEKHNITPPNIRIEEKYRKMGSEVSYITMGGELVAMFIMTYKTDREIAHSLRLLEDNGVSFVIRSIDCNLTPEFIAEKFSLLPRCIKVLPTGLGTIANEEMTKKERNSRAYLVTNGKLKAFACAVAGCIKMKSTVNIAKIIQYLAVGLGLVLVVFISFISGFAKLGILEMLIYNGFWIAAMIIVSAIVKKLL